MRKKQKKPASLYWTEDDVQCLIETLNGLVEHVSRLNHRVKALEARPIPKPVNYS